LIITFFIFCVNRVDKKILEAIDEGAALTEADAKVLERLCRRVKEIDGYDERLREKRMIIFFSDSS